MVPKDFDVERSKNTDGAGLLEGGAGLQRDFDDAWCVVGFNSNVRLRVQWKVFHF